MSETIWKFPLDTTDRQNVTMPEGAEILTVQTQNESPCLWALVTDEFKRPRVDRAIEIFGTGHSIHSDMGVARKYIGTYQLHGGALVFHVFERTD